VADENGLQKDDVILAVDGNSFVDLFGIKKYLHFKNWDDQISFRIKRGEEEQEISFVLQPVEDED
jgi:S1-C subfamily serine protease